MSYAEDIGKKKKKLRVPINRAEAFPRVKSNGMGQRVVAREEVYHAVSGNDNSKRSNGHKLVSTCGDTNLHSPTLVVASHKRRHPGIESNQIEKRRKINRDMIKHCYNILKELTAHPFGWIFSKPVDPVAMNIPDYFSIVTEPMDLGTVSANLEKYTYSSVEEFEADVRLTFSNAILYNPPENQVHIAAKELNHIFDTRWRFVKARWNLDRENPNFVLKPCGKEMDANVSRQNNHVNLRIDNESFTEKFEPTKPVKMQKDCRKRPVRIIAHKGFPSSENAKQPTQADPGCTSCGSMKCQCHLQNNSSHAFPSDLSSERSGAHDLDSLRGGESKSKPISASQITKPVPGSDGVDASSLGRNSIEDIQLLPVSPKKALRAAMLVARFSGIIVKSAHGDNADPVKIKEEKCKLERQQEIEKQRIEDEMKASREKLEKERQKEIAAARKSARLALEKMERTLVIEDNLYNFKEIERLCKCSLSDPGFSNVMRSIGLFIKDDE